MGNIRDEYGFLRIFYKYDSKIIDFLESKIDAEDLDEEFGIEKESHVTVLFGFLPEVTKEQISHFFNSEKSEKRELSTCSFQRFFSSIVKCPDMPIIV